MYTQNFVDMWETQLGRRCLTRVLPSLEKCGIDLLNAPYRLQPTVLQQMKYTIEEL